MTPKYLRPEQREFLHECFEIDKDTPSGLRWRLRPRHHFETHHAWKVWNSRWADRPAGSYGKRHGDWVVYINKTVYFTVDIITTMEGEFDA